MNHNYKPQRKVRNNRFENLVFASVGLAIIFGFIAFFHCFGGINNDKYCLIHQGEGNINWKNYLANKIAYLLPNRVVYWVIIRAFAYTTVHSHPDKSPDEVGFNLLAKSWEYKHKHNLNDKQSNWKVYNHKEYKI